MQNLAGTTAGIEDARLILAKTLIAQSARAALVIAVTNREVPC